MPCARCLVSNVLGTTKGSKLFNPTGQPSFLNGRLLNSLFDFDNPASEIGTLRMIIRHDLFG